MISETTKKYCSEPLENIENYDKAVADTKHIWDCHHRAEILPCGVYSRKDLKKFGLYWHRPASELIFLRHDEHIRIHGSNLSTKTKRRMAESHKGNLHSSETRRKMAESHKGRHLPDEVRRKISESQKGKVVSQSTRLKMSRSVKMIRLCDGCEMTFQSLRDAEIWLRDNNFPLAAQSNISRCCRGRRKSIYGARWEYANELV